MSASAYWLRIGGIPATEIAAHTAPTWETHADGGIGQVSWAFALSMHSQHQALKSGALVEVMCGPMRVATAQMTEPDRTTWECVAFGLSSSLRRFLALDAGASTRNVGTAITTAQAAGWRGSNPAPVTGTAAGDATGNPVNVGNLLDDYAEQTGQRWGADGSGRLYMRPDPTTPTWLASPGSAAFGATNEDAPAFLAGRYVDALGVNQDAYSGAGEPQDAVDITDRGALTPPAAEAILAGMLTRRGLTQWTNGVTLHREQLTNRGGTSAAFASVVAGQMLRVHGLSSGVITQAPWLDVTIGKTRYTAGEDTIYLEPINTAPRTLTGVLAAA